MATFKLIKNVYDTHPNWYLSISSLAELYSYIAHIEGLEENDIEQAKTDLKNRSHFRSDIASTANTMCFANNLTGGFEKYGSEQDLLTWIDRLRSGTRKHFGISYRDHLLPLDHIGIPQLVCRMIPSTFPWF